MRLGDGVGGALVVCDMLKLSKSIGVNGEVEETILDEGKLGLREVVRSRGVVDFGFTTKVNGF